jgi:hypothetical protein
MHRTCCIATGGNYNDLACSGLRPLSLHHAAFLAVQAHDKAMCQQKDPRHSSVVLRLDKPCKYWPSEQCVYTRDFRIEFVHLSIWSKCPDSRIDRASSRMQLSPEVKAMKQRRHSERLMVCILSSISLFGTGKVVTQSSHERVTARGKLRWSFQKLSMPIARMSCPRPGTSAYPTQTPSLLGHLPISSSSTQFYRSFEAQHLFISLQTASKQSVAFQRCTLNVSPKYG